MEIMLLLVNNLQEKLITETQEGRSFGSARTTSATVLVLQLCTRVKLKIHTFSANQTCVIFSFMVYCLYDKPSQTCFFIGSYDLLEKRHEDDVTIKNILPFLSYKKNSM